MATLCPSCGLARISFLLFFLLLFSVAFGFPADYGKVTTEKVAEGIYQFSVSDYGDVGLSGNSVAIIGKEGVLFFDTAGTPATARVILQELKKITAQPVRYVVNSHWHWDHWGGNEVFKAAFPDVQIISHQKTREMMMHDAVDWNREYLATAIPDHIKQIDDAVAKAEVSSSSPESLARLKGLADADREFLQQKRTITNTFPNQVFSESMRIYLGDREVQVLHARAITPGDAFIYLPKERILLTGDILVYPIPFAIGGTYPAMWIEALERLKSLDPHVIVPGHGPVERDQTFLDQNIKLFLRVHEDVARAKALGSSLEQTKELLGKSAAQYAAILGLDEKSLPSFQAYFLDGFVKNSYLELVHPLSDTPTR
jgi:cyclase